MSDGQTAELQMTSNPNPHTDMRVALINKGAVVDSKSDDYKELKKLFLSAAKTITDAYEELYGSWHANEEGRRYFVRSHNRQQLDYWVAGRLAEAAPTTLPNESVK